MKKKPDHVARARKAYPIMRKLAHQKDRSTYKQLTDQLGLHHRTAQWFLGVIQKWCLANKLPPLQALIYSKATGVPGTGYIASKRGGTEYKQALKNVYAFEWPKNVPF